jgi:hypothetical protein
LLSLCGIWLWSFPLSVGSNCPCSLSIRVLVWSL